MKVINDSPLMTRKEEGYIYIALLASEQLKCAFPQQGEGMVCFVLIQWLVPLLQFVFHICHYL